MMQAVDLTFRKMTFMMGCLDDIHSTLLIGFAIHTESPFTSLNAIHANLPFMRKVAFTANLPFTVNCIHHS